MSRERLREFRQELQQLVEQGPPSEYDFGQPMVSDIASPSFGNFPREAEHRQACSDYWQRREELVTQAARLVEGLNLDSTPILRLLDEDASHENAAEAWVAMRRAELLPERQGTETPAKPPANNVQLAEARAYHFAHESRSRDGFIRLLASGKAAEFFTDEAYLEQIRKYDPDELWSEYEAGRTQRKRLKGKSTRDI